LTSACGKKREKKHVNLFVKILLDVRSKKCLEEKHTILILNHRKNIPLLLSSIHVIMQVEDG